MFYFIKKVLIFYLLNLNTILACCLTETTATKVILIQKNKIKYKKKQQQN